jgi:hypothetical protein
MHKDIYYGAESAKQAAMRDHDRWNNGADKFNKFLKRIIEMSTTPGIVEDYRVIPQEDLSVSIHYVVRIDKFRKYFPTESPFEISSTLMKAPSVWLVRMCFDPTGKPYVIVDIEA